MTRVKNIFLLVNSFLVVGGIACSEIPTARGEESVKGLRFFLDSAIYFFCLRDLGLLDELVSNDQPHGGVSYVEALRMIPVDQYSLDLSLAVDRRLGLFERHEDLKGGHFLGVVLEYLRDNKIDHINNSIDLGISLEKVPLKSRWATFSYLLNYQVIFSSREKFKKFIENSLLLFNDTKTSSWFPFEGIKKIMRDPFPVKTSTSKSKSVTPLYRGNNFFKSITSTEFIQALAGQNYNFNNKNYRGDNVLGSIFDLDIVSADDGRFLLVFLDTLIRDHEFDIHAQNAAGETLLLIAAKKGFGDSFLRELIDRGLDPLTEDIRHLNVLLYLQNLRVGSSNPILSSLSDEDLKTQRLKYGKVLEDIRRYEHFSTLTLKNVSELIAEARTNNVIRKILEEKLGSLNKLRDLMLLIHFLEEEQKRRFQGKLARFVLYAGGAASLVAVAYFSYLKKNSVVDFFSGRSLFRMGK